MTATRRLLIVAAVLVTMDFACGAPQQRARKRNRSSGSTEKDLLAAMNEARSRAHVGPLEWHEAAANLARSHATAMARGGFFSHTDPERGDLAERIKRTEIRWSAVAENLFKQRGCVDAVACAVQGWTKSPGHRRNMLNAAYTHAGTGISADNHGVMYYCAIYLRGMSETRR